MNHFIYGMKVLHNQLMTTPQQKKELGMFLKAISKHLITYWGEIEEENLEESYDIDYNEIFEELQEEGVDTTYLNTLDKNNIRFEVDSVAMVVYGVGRFKCSNKVKGEVKEEEETIDITEFMD